MTDETELRQIAILYAVPLAVVIHRAQLESAEGGITLERSGKTTRMGSRDGGFLLRLFRELDVADALPDVATLIQRAPDEMEITAHA